MPTNPSMESMSDNLSPREVDSIFQQLRDLNQKFSTLQSLLTSDLLVRLGQLEQWKEIHEGTKVEDRLAVVEKTSERHAFVVNGLMAAFGVIGAGIIQHVFFGKGP